MYLIHSYLRQCSEPFSVIEMIRSKYPFAELTYTELKPYTRYLDSLVEQNKLSVKVDTSNPFATKVYYLTSLQKTFWY